MKLRYAAGAWTDNCSCVIGISHILVGHAQDACMDVGGKVETGPEAERRAKDHYKNSQKSEAASIRVSQPSIGPALIMHEIQIFMEKTE